MVFFGEWIHRSEHVAGGGESVTGGVVVDGEASEEGELFGGVFEGVGGGAARGVHRQAVGVSGGESKWHVPMVFANIRISA